MKLISILFLLLLTVNSFSQNVLKVTNSLKNKQVLIKENFKITVQTNDTTVKGRYQIINDSTISIGSTIFSIYNINKITCSHIKARKIGTIIASTCGGLILTGGIVDLATGKNGSDVGFRAKTLGYTGLISVYPLVTAIGLLSAHHRFNFNKNWRIEIVQLSN
ncbi:MAG: hypothetical protein H6553_09495 [Chitinophagales bacterium]|nr:hypothetical protein [Chitinophagales bacterium]